MRTELRLLESIQPNKLPINFTLRIVAAASLILAAIRWTKDFSGDLEEFLLPKDFFLPAVAEVLCMGGASGIGISGAVSALSALKAMKAVNRIATDPMTSKVMLRHEVFLGRRRTCWFTRRTTSC